MEYILSIYVDELVNHQGKFWCHMATDSADLEELHQFAESIGLKRAWFQPHSKVSHYDLVPSKRALAIKAGAKPLKAVELFKLCKRDRDGM